MKNFLKRGISSSVDWLLYKALSEKQKEKLVNVLSEQQKEKIKAWLPTGKKLADKNKIKAIRDHLYTLGFYEEAVAHLRAFADVKENSFIKKLAAWELAQWYANQNDKAEASKALPYLEIAKHKTKDVRQLRRIAIIEAECLDLMGKREAAETVIQSRLKIEAHPDLYLAQANLIDDIRERFRWINKAYTFHKLEEIKLNNFENPNYNDLACRSSVETINDEKHKVSVLLPAFKAEDGIHVAIESILNQSWQNLELIIVDDCSPDNTKAVAESYAKNDSRVKVLQTPKNGGPYIARNIALENATGEFITVNDADDWSHPRKLELQVQHLIENSNAIANTSSHARLTEDLKLYRRGTPGKYLFPNMSSIMFRKKEVVHALGAWDSVRFAADGEFKRRLLQAFGKASYVDLELGPLSLPRQSVSSLTSSSAFGYNGFFMGVRKEYVESFSYSHQHHETIKYVYPMTKRPFPVPEPMWPQREDKIEGVRHFDFVFIGDFRKSNKLEHIIKASQIDNVKIGLVQTYDYNIESSTAVAEDYRDNIDGKTIQMLVFGENILSDTIVLLDNTMIKNEQKYVPQIKAKAVYSLDFEDVYENHNIEFIKRETKKILQFEDHWNEFKSGENDE